MFKQRLFNSPLACATLMLAPSLAAATAPPPLYTPAASYNFNDKIVSTTVFHWFGATDGQQIGPWRPLEGRPAWDGGVDFWKRQIKDIMDANVQTMYVHLMTDPAHEQRRVNLFQAAGELRGAGYNVPKIAPFLDPAVIYPTANPPTIDLATQAGKDDFVGHYKRFYDQYFSVNPDAHAADYIARINNKPVLNTWHILPEQIANRTSLSRADVESRLSDDAWAHHAPFESGVYMVGTGLNNTYPVFADERLVQFETHDYYRSVVHDPAGSPPAVRTAQVKAGYWDQNLPQEFRPNDSFIPRAGGTHYANAWNSAINQANLLRVNIESWNEYDEGSGIYEANPGPPYIDPGNEDPNTDTWSNSNNPREYIDLTTAGARQFNGITDHDASILWHNFPTKMYSGTKHNVSVVVRNEGDLEWSAAQDFKFGQQEFLSGETMFSPGRYLIDDTKDEIPKYGGIFRGRPKLFDISIVAPAGTGTYETHWGMLQEHVTWFGQTITAPIQVLPKVVGDADVDGDVDFDDIEAVAPSWRTHSGADWPMGDFDGDGDFDRTDFNVLAAVHPAGAAAALAHFESLVPHWAANASGSWQNASNWGGLPAGTPNGVDATATFGRVTSQGRLAYTNTPITLGTITFDSDHQYLLTGTGTLTLQVSGGLGLVEVLRGSHKLNLPITIASDTLITVTGGSQLIIADPLTVASGRTLTHSGAGAVTYQSIVTLGSGATIAFDAAAEVAELSMAEDATADVSAALRIRAGSVEEVRAKISTGLIASAAAARDPARATALGLRGDADGVFIRHTFYGDTDLDGAVDLADFQRFVTGYDIGGLAAWFSGDFDYSGGVDAGDFDLYLRGLINQGRAIYTPDLFAALSSFAAAEGLDVDLTAVPEPAGAALLAAAALALRRRRT